MSDNLEMWEQDKAWLHEHLFHVTVDEEDIFCEKVAAFTQQDGLSDKAARDDALLLIIEARL